MGTNTDLTIDRILIVGPIGSGKSFLGRLLAKELAVPLFDAVYACEDYLTCNGIKINNDSCGIFISQEDLSTSFSFSKIITIKEPVCGIDGIKI